MSEDGIFDDDTETRPVSDREIKYLIGKAGATRLRIEKFSGTKLKVEGERGKRQILTIKGSGAQRDLAILAVNVITQQMDGDKVTLDYQDLESRFVDRLSTIDVPNAQVGVLIGTRGETMRAMERKHKTFMFFKTEELAADSKCLYILGDKEARRVAVAEVIHILELPKRAIHPDRLIDQRGNNRRDHERRDRPEPSDNHRDRDHQHVTRLDDHRDHQHVTRLDDHHDHQHHQHHQHTTRPDSRRVQEWLLTEQEQFNEWRHHDEWRRYNEWRRSNTR